MNITIRRSEPDDALNGLVQTLNNLAKVGLSTYQARLSIMRPLCKCATYVAVDQSGTVVGTITVLIRKTLLHRNGKIAYLEEVATRQGYEHQGIASRLIKQALTIAKEENCYKVLLACKLKLTDFYQKFGFHKHEILMRLDL